VTPVTVPGAPTIGVGCTGKRHIGDRQVGEEAPETTMQKLVVLGARTAGTAAATALASRVLGRITDRSA